MPRATDGVKLAYNQITVEQREMEYHEISQPSSNGPGVGLIKGVALLENGHIPNHSSQSEYTSSAGHASDRILSPETDSNICIDQLLSDVLNSSRTKPAKPIKTSRTYSWMSRDPDGSTDSPDLVPRRDSKKLLEKTPRKNGLRSPHPMQSSMQTKNSKLKVDILQKSKKNSYDISCDHDGQYSSSCQHLDSSEHINIYEYEKARPSQEDRYSEYYGYHRYLHPYQKRSSKGGKLDEVDDDQFNVFICMLFCIMGLGVIIGLVILLCQYVDQKEQDQEKAGLGPVDEDCIQLWNNVYFRRVAHLIERVDKHSLALSSEAKEKLWLCPLDSPLLGKRFFCFFFKECASVCFALF
uniref:Uncharacterized protein n=2 Tax=Biomphalaria glabrata TaxID=6526 RepID=A0A2C9M575_BIOGL